MTTLPQTTPMRLPRPGGGGQIAIPSASPTGLGAPASSGGIQMTGSDVWRVFRSNWWLILGMVALMAVAALFVNRYLAAHYPVYTAGGLVKVQLREEVFRENTADEVSASPQAIELEQTTQARSLVQPGLMLNVLSNSEKIRGTEWFKEFSNPEDAKEDLIENFSATPVKNTRLIMIQMSYRVPRDARTIAEEIVNEYMSSQQARAKTGWEDQARTLSEQLTGYERDNRKLNETLTDKQSALGSENLFQLYSMLEGKKYELARLTDTRQEANRDFVAAKNTFESINKLLNSGDTPPEVEAMVVQSLALNSYQRQIDELDGEISQLAGTNSPRAQSLKRARQAAADKLTDQEEKLRSANIAQIRSEAETELKTAEEAKNAAESRIQVTNDEIRKMQAAATTYKQVEEQQKTLKEKMDGVRDELETIQRRKLPSSYSPVEWQMQPPTPETPSFPKLPMTMAVAVMLGLALSIGIAFLREITDTSIRSPRDIARVGQMNLLGMIPHESDDPQAAGARLPLVIFDAPHSMAAEEFRKLRTRLQHTAALDSTRSLLVSSANPGDGKTTVACNLAAGLALNGRRILLVDANFRRPDIHNIFEVANEQGFSDVLNDMAAFDTAVRDTPVQNLYVMPTGPKPVNATELLESQLLIDFIERSLEDYDHVIFDSGPLLIVSETMALAPRVDGVITVVRARTNSRGVLQRMRDVLRQVKSEHLGVVLNAVRSQGGGYYGRNIKTYYAYQNS